MLRYFATLLLPAVLFLNSPAPAQAQYLPRGAKPGWRARVPDLAGDYVTQGGDPCSVERRGRAYVFINENGSWARFVFTGPNRLEQVAGQWDRSVVCTVKRDRSGRTVLRFSSPNAPPGYWYSDD
jgi:hypothetical protein